MHQNLQATAVVSPQSNRLRVGLVCLFIGSGCAALIYEVVWFQLLELVIGTSSVSLGVLLSAFMGGMCLGSLALPRFVSARHHPLRVYAALELGIGLLGLLVLVGMPLVGGVYTAWAGDGVAGLLFRALVAGVCLAPPTMLMGATLPAIARYVEATPRGVSWLGFFYGGNIAGAVLGSLAAGFYLLRIHDVTVATFAAAGLNLIVAGTALALSRRGAYTPPERSPNSIEWRRSAWPVYVTLALSGVTALAAQVIWTRHLSLLFGATVYTFALILAVFLSGLGAGSSAGALLARHLDRPRLALGVSQLLLAGAMAWSAYTIAASLPYWPIDVTGLASPWISVQLDVLRTLWAILPATLLWGASFPLALAAAASPGQDPGRLVGGLYAANTVGAIVGSLAASLVLIVWLGSQQAQQLLIGCAVLGALIAWAPVGVDAGRPMRLRMKPVAGLVAGVALAGLLLAMVPALPDLFVAYGRFMNFRGTPPQVIYVGEGLTGSVAVSIQGDILNYHNAGKIQASSYLVDMRLQRMLGHLTTLIPEDPDSVFVIGLGAGVTAGAVSIDPEVEQVTVAEIEPLVPEVVSEYFGRQNHGVVENPKVAIRIDDGRHYLQTTDETFDAITSDPLDPWVKGAAMLYTEEFWRIVRSRLNPGGVVTVFVQLYESTEAAVRSEVATFFKVFPNGAVFANTVRGEGYDLVLAGLADPGGTIDVDRVVDRLEDPRYRDVARSLAAVEFYSGADLLGMFAGQAEDLADWLEGAEINRDRNLRLQYLAGAGHNLYQAEAIFNRMVSAGVRFPRDLFTGSTERLLALERAIAARQGRD